jgi:bis(5'-nucleosidyl)-tetraphosphatase
MAQPEQSAGLVVWRSDDKPPHQRLYLLLDYGHHWDYPKGHLEKGETPVQAAVRELEEETGITDVTLAEGFARQITYFFRDKKKRLVRKSVVFFIAQTKTSEVRISDEHVGYLFAPFDEAVQRLTYATAKQILREADAFLGT